MQDPIERLRATDARRAEEAQWRREGGRPIGREWAEERATADDLRRLAAAAGRDPGRLARGADSAGRVARAVTGEFADFSVAEVPAEGWWAFGYLTLVGSVVAFSAFVWLLGNARPSLVTTYAYVNPVVAVLLGWLILSEPVTIPVVLGGSLAVVGVALVVSAERPRSPSEPEEVVQHG